MGLRSSKVRGVFEHALETTSLRSGFVHFRELSPNFPEVGLAELSSAVEAGPDVILRALERAETSFWNRMRRLESWARASRFLTAVLAFITLMYVIGSLRQMAIGLAAETKHNGAVVFHSLYEILNVVLRNTWLLFFLFALNKILTALVHDRKDRWDFLFSQLRRRAVREDY